MGLSGILQNITEHELCKFCRMTATKTHTKVPYFMVPHKENPLCELFVTLIYKSWFHTNEMTKKPSIFCDTVYTV